MTLPMRLDDLTYKGMTLPMRGDDLTYEVR